MISFVEAQRLVLSHVRPLVQKKISVGDSSGLVIAQDIFAPMDLPPFDNSSVDGFAVRLPISVNTKILGTIGAGDVPPKGLELGEAWHVMTGAAIPSGCDAVVMQEISLDGARPLKGDGIRRRGEDVLSGSCVMKKNMQIKPQHVGLLLGLGIHEIQATPRPKVAIISTGSELIDPGNPLEVGQVYYLTGPMLASQIVAMGAEVVSVQRVNDSLNATVDAITQILPTADMILLTGGMADGQFDFVKPALRQLGAQEIFYKGAWRPGKPLFFGTIEGRSVFGIPGNPVACFVICHLFVSQALRQLQGRQAELPWKSGILMKDFEKPHGFTFFARAKVEENRIEILPGQGSHQLGALAKANAIAMFPEHSLAREGAAVDYLEI